MIFDRRVKPELNKVALKPADLPRDYLKIVEETLIESLKNGLKELEKFHPICTLKVGGAIYSDEVLLAVTISHGDQSLIATTFYSSADFNPLLPEPGIEDVLNACLDSVGTILDYYLDATHPERIAQVADAPIGALEEAPFEWTQTKLDDHKIATWVKIDKLNPALEALADDWLQKNDPSYSKEDEAMEAEEFLNERLEAIKNAKSGSSGNSGPITH